MSEAVPHETARVRGEEIPLALLPERISGTADRALRAEMAKVDSERQADVAAALAARLLSAPGRSDAEALAPRAERFLVRTRDLARDAVTWARKRDSDLPSRGRLEGHDLVRLARAAPHDARFSPDRVTAVVASTALAMRLRPAAGGQTKGGLAGLRAAFRAAAPDGSATLLDRLAANEIWLGRTAEVEGGAVESVVRAAALAMLLEVRQAAVIAPFETALRRGLDDPAETYRARMSEAMDADWPPGRWAADVEAGLAERLRDFLVEPAHHALVRERFDEDWFRNPRAGPFLEAGLPAPEPDEEALARRFEEVLG